MMDANTRPDKEMLPRVFPRWLLVSYTLFFAVVVPIYWIYYGPQNFLWGCDIALLLTLIALWRESSLPASMALLVTLIPDIFWNLDFILRLTAGSNLAGADATAYMFEPTLPVFVRALSLFHVFMAPLLIWMVYRIGYDPRGLLWQSVLTWVVIPISYVVSDAERNINWVYGVGPLPPPWMPPTIYLIVFMLAVPVILYLPAHLIMKHWFIRPNVVTETVSGN